MRAMPAMPPEFIVNPEEKLLIVTPVLEHALPHVEEAFETVDESFSKDTEAFLKRLENDSLSFRSSTGAAIDYSLIPGKGNEMLIMWSPFSDCAPKSDAETVYRYAKSDEAVSKSNAAPNSWNQTTKSAMASELLKAVDREMTVLTIFSPLQSIPHNAYSFGERTEVRRGDFTPSARIVEEAIRDAQQRMHGLTSETQLDAFHFHGASLGASSAIGAASQFVARGTNVRSVTAQELILGPSKVFPDLAARFTVKARDGEASQLEVPEHYARIAEPLMRRMIDRDGYELATFGRMAQGMSKLTRLKGLTRPAHNQTPQAIERLVENGTSVVIPLAENSGLTKETAAYLPGAGEQVVQVKAEKSRIDDKDNYADHLIDEHVALTALIAVLNVRNNK